MNRIRTVAFTLYLIFATFVIALVFSPTLIVGGRAARRVVQIWSRWMLRGLKIICGLRYRIEGVEHIPQGGALIVSNHQSMWETMALFAVLSDPIIVFKRELARVPIYGWWAVRSNSIAVDRSAGAPAIRALTKAARARIGEGLQLILFPEGTRTPLGERRPLQPGVAAIYNAIEAPCVTAVHNSGRFWRFPGRIGSLKIPGVITMRFEPPLEQGLDRRAFIGELERRFAAMLDEPAGVDASSKIDVRASERAAPA